MCFFFFKQKTAYEMRISDWSSDVCSSDLRCDVGRVAREQVGFAARRVIFGKRGDVLEQRRAGRIVEPARGNRLSPLREAGVNVGVDIRSEEHTSELQSLMRISYAVFCLKKKQQILYIITRKVNTTVIRQTHIIP